MKDTHTDIICARGRLAKALRYASIHGEGLDSAVSTADGAGTVESGPALAFRASIWALETQIRAIPAGPLDLMVHDAMVECAVAWAAYAETLPEGPERRQAQRASETVGGVQ